MCNRADASPSLGQNSLFSCTPSSTCCKYSNCDPTDVDAFVMCEICPLPAIPGTNKFGCDGLRQKCACGVAQTSYDKCSSNRQCDRNSQCLLVSSLNSINYGTIPCGQCPSSGIVMCMLPLSGLPGQCSCVMDHTISYDLCTNQIGSITMVDSSKICGYIPGYPITSLNWAFDLDDLVMLPCIQASKAVCSTVHFSSSGSLMMSVAVTVRMSQNSRRLLMEDDVISEEYPNLHTFESEYELVNSKTMHDILMSPGWNMTSAPCSSLCMAYQQKQKLGIFETYELNKCGYWRFVGKRIIERFNLTKMNKYDTFLLSMDDFSHSILNSNIVYYAISNPRIIVEIFMYHPWAKPLRAMGTLMANFAEHLQWVKSIERDIEDTVFSEEDTRVLNLGIRNYREKNHDMSLIYNTSHDNRRIILNETLSIRSRNLHPHDIPSKNLNVLNLKDINNNNTITFRKLLSFSQESGSDAFSWPPVFDFSLEACPLGLTVLRISMEIFTVNSLYFQNFDKETPKIDRSLRATLPKPSWVVNRTAIILDYSRNSWASVSFHWLLDLMSIRPEDIIHFFIGSDQWTLQWIVDTSIKCDLPAVLTCSRHDKDLLMSIVVFGIFYVLLNLIGNAIGFPMLSTWFILSFPWFILWYTFGVSPACTPMIPPCLLSDVIENVKILLPVSIELPAQLLCDPALPLNQTCLRSCTDLSFVTWFDPLAFALCDVDMISCGYISTIQTSWSIFVPIIQSFEKYRKLLTNATLDPAAYRICTWVTFIMVIPMLTFMVSVILVVIALAISVLNLIPMMATFVAQLYIFFWTR